MDKTREDDRTLIRAANSGEASAFEAIYFRYRDWVVGMAYRFTGNQEDALDVLQDTFAYLLRKFPGFCLSSNMKTFLYPVVRNLSIAARRKRNRHVSGDEIFADVPAPPPTAGGSSRAELAAVLSALPEAQREALLMRFVDGMALQEIAEALGIPPGTVKSRIHNALETLRKDARTRTYFLE
jgi:RNA polymerase sigma-70 factor (ECF subfamily)